LLSSPSSPPVDAASSENYHSPSLLSRFGETITG
jgi:hypothetical protein